jgi:hypothetical protein
VMLTLAAIVGLVGFAGRVYQNAILRTGALVRLRDVWHRKQVARPPERRPRPIETVTGMFATPHQATVWSAVLTTLGVLIAAVVFALTNDVIWSVTALLVTYVAVRRVIQHR